MKPETKTFCKIMASGIVTAETAHELAFTMTDKKDIIPVSKLMKDDKVIAKIEKYKKDRELMSKIDRDYLKAETVTLLEMSKNEGQLSVTRACIDTLAKLSGYYEDAKDSVPITMNMVY